MQPIQQTQILSGGAEFLPLILAILLALGGRALWKRYAKKSDGQTSALSEKVWIILNWLCFAIAAYLPFMYHESMNAYVDFGIKTGKLPAGSNHHSFGEALRLSWFWWLIAAVLLYRGIRPFISQKYQRLPESHYPPEVEAAAQPKAKVPPVSIGFLLALLYVPLYVFGALTGLNFVLTLSDGGVPLQVVLFQAVICSISLLGAHFIRRYSTMRAVVTARVLQEKLPAVDPATNHSVPFRVRQNKILTILSMVTAITAIVGTVTYTSVNHRNRIQDEARLGVVDGLQRVKKSVEEYVVAYGSLPTSIVELNLNLTGNSTIDGVHIDHDKAVLVYFKHQNGRSKVLLSPNLDNRKLAWTCGSTDLPRQLSPPDCN